MMIQTFTKMIYVMKSYNEFKAEIKTIQQKMTVALKKVKELFREFGFSAGMLSVVAVNPNKSNFDILT
tara:strand:+ start:76 stop:279 length:204 start_codon:yes stop_codon:yes gene_type:complete